MNKIRRLGIMLLCMILFVFALSACEAEEPVKANNVEAVAETAEDAGSEVEVTNDLDLTGFGKDIAFAPSVSYKEGMIILQAIVGEGDFDGDGLTCIEVTNLKQAKEKTTDVTQEARDLLVEVYEALVAGDMTLPIEEDYVVRELVDISFKQKGCVELEDHDPKREELAKEDVLLKLKIDLGISAEDELVVLYYLDGEWLEAIDLVNNGDGTVELYVEDLCPFAFCVK